MFHQKSTVLATCQRGISPYLQQEMLALGFNTHASAFGVSTQGTLTDCMQLCLHLRTAHKVLFEITRFQAGGPDELYTQVKKIPWEKMLQVPGYFTVQSVVNSHGVKNSHFAELRVKDAVADRCTEKLGERPHCGPLRNRAGIFLYWKDSKAILYLDAAGDSLSRRGYRKMPHLAPMQETLAAAVLLASKWKEKLACGGGFISPMCGSGTLGIEAVSIAINQAPGILRDNFGFMHLKGFPQHTWDILCANAGAAEKKPERVLHSSIICTDKDEKAIKAAKENTRMAGFLPFFQFDVCDFQKTPLPLKTGMIIVNPQYGKRMDTGTGLTHLYKSIGDFFKNSCQGYTGYIFTGNLPLAKHVGLRTSRRIPFYNAKIECRLLEYELYAGSKK